MGTVRAQSEGDFVLNLMHLKIMPKFGLHLIYMKSVVQYRYIYIYNILCIGISFFLCIDFFFSVYCIPRLKELLIKYKPALSV